MEKQIINEKKMDTSRKGAKFVASFSGGKDSTLAIYRAIKEGMIPLELLTTYNIDREMSWFHGIPKEILYRVSEEIKIPLSVMYTKGDEYTANFELKLKEAKEKGAKYCIFGDIDLEGHRKWCTERCEAAGLEAYFPLWNESRKKIVYEFVDLGFKSFINVIDGNRLSEDFAGQVLSRNLVDQIEAYGADICGENGEYHTFVFDGPLFTKPVEFTCGEKTQVGKNIVIPINHPE